MQRCKMNQNSTAGFSAAGSSFDLFECIAESNGASGFLVTNGMSLLTGCVSQFNTLHGFDLGALSDAMVQNCTATHNGGRGFNNAVAANRFYSNVACNNAAPNYNGVVSATVVGANVALAFQNVDCTM
jgi:hypothetical protein